MRLEIVIPPGLAPPPVRGKPAASRGERQAAPPPYRLRLEPPPGAGGAVIRDGLEPGKLPQALCLPVGEWRLTLEAPGADSSSAIVEVLAPGPIASRVPPPVLVAR